MQASMRAAKIRIFILLLIVCASAYGWETSRNAQLQPVTGQVIGTVYLGYKVAYQLQGNNYQFEQRIGLFDRFGGLAGLSPNAPIAVLAHPDKPHAALINTVNSRYGITLSFVGLLCIFVVAMLLVALRGNNTTGTA